MSLVGGHMNTTNNSARAGQTETIVTVDALSKTYYPSPPWMRALVRSNIKREVHALDDVSFELRAGQIMAVVGPNGAGKSTTFRVIIGLTTPTRGTSNVLGYDSHHEARTVRRLVGWMPAEERSLFMRLTCEENLRFHGRLQGMRGRPLKSRIGEVLEMVGLSDVAKNVPFALSAGMKARLQLARALLHAPQLLILDEPTGSVDPVAAHHLLELIIGIVADQQIAALISSHRLEEIEALHSDVILLDKGKVRYRGDLDELRGEWERPQLELEFSTEANAAQAVLQIKRSGLGDPVADGPQVRCGIAPDVTAGQILATLDGVEESLVHIRDVRMPLRDLLAAMYRTGGAE